MLLFHTGFVLYTGDWFSWSFRGCSNFNNISCCCGTNWGWVCHLIVRCWVHCMEVSVTIQCNVLLWSAQLRLDASNYSVLVFVQILYQQNNLYSLHTRVNHGDNSTSSKVILKTPVKGFRCPLLQSYYFSHFVLESGLYYIMKWGHCRRPFNLWAWTILPGLSSSNCSFCVLFNLLVEHMCGYEFNTSVVWLRFILWGGNLDIRP